MSRSSGRFQNLQPVEPDSPQPQWVQTLRRTGPWLALILLVLLTMGRTFVLVGAGERAVIFNRFTGTQHVQLGEGLHPLLPWVQSATLYDIKTHTYTMSQTGNEADQQGSAHDALTALTADGLPVSLDVSVLYHLDPNQVWKMHQEIGPQFLAKVIRPQSRAEARMTVAKYTVTDVYGARRAALIEEMNNRLRELFARNHLVLDEVLVRDVRFSDEFHQAIEQKQVAQQDVQRMRFVLDQADKERRRKIIEAEAEAESIRLKAAALAQNPQLVEYEYVKGLPDRVNTVVTDGRAIVNVGEVSKGSAAGAAAAEGGK